MNRIRLQTEIRQRNTAQLFDFLCISIPRDMVYAKLIQAVDSGSRKGDRDAFCFFFNISDIDDIVMNTTGKMGGIPADLGYQGFPKSVCTSINEEVCHGIPSEDIILREGDIVNVDCSTILDGYYSDSSRMFCIGEVSPEKKRLVDVTKECLEEGLKAVIPWTPIGDMGNAVHQHALKNGYTVVREIGGHGCGNDFHEEPFVSFVSEPGTGMLMVPGMVFTIEPMVNMGGNEIFVDEENDWTVYTADLKPSAQWEVELLVTETGYELLCW